MAATPILDRSCLAQGYPAQVKAGIVHLGVGNFHRAHQAVYIDRLLAKQPQWGIVGASLRRPNLRDALAPQQHCYCVLSRQDERNDCQVVGSLLDCIVAQQELDRLLALLADPAIRIVSLTVTEKGYCHQPGTNELDTALQSVQADLATPHQPSSTVGILAEALCSRLANGVAPFTVVSCDNLPANGKLTAQMVSQLAREQGRAEAQRIVDEVRFPCSMVDRIVPATTDVDRDEVLRQIGRTDAWPVPAEAFSQWILEDDFSNGRPALEEVGVELVNDVMPYEKMKLRVLNGSHFALAYMGLARGHELVSQSMADEQLVSFVRRMLAEEVAWTCAAAPGMDVNAYVNTTLRRFENTGIKHRLEQISLDGSQKIGMRIIEPLSLNLKNGRACPHLELVCAAWLAHWHFGLRSGTALASDPLQNQIGKLFAHHGEKLEDFIAKSVSELGVFAELADNLELSQRMVAAGTSWRADTNSAFASVSE